MYKSREILFTYDSIRGGFLLQLGPFSRKRQRPLFGGLMTAFLGEGDLIEAVESFWAGSGGLPLRGIHQAKSCPFGRYQIAGDQLRVGTVLVRQAPDKLAIWFSTGSEFPRRHWKALQDFSTAIVAYFSHRKAKAGWPIPGAPGESKIEMLAGLEIGLARTVAEYPIASINFEIEDFK